MADTKYCPDCEAHVPKDRFGKNSSKADGLTSYCREHISARDRQKYARNSAPHRERQRLLKLQRPEKLAESQRRAKLKSKYGITLEDYNAMVRACGGCCAICREQKPLQVDHCHTTNQVRGLLCWQCNVAIGNMRDSVERLQAAITYLQLGQAFN